MQDDALTNLVTLAVVFHQAEIFVPAVGGFDGTQEQGGFLHYDYSTTALDRQDKSVDYLLIVCHYTF